MFGIFYRILKPSILRFGYRHKKVKNLDFMSKKIIEQPISELILAIRKVNKLTQTEFGKFFEPSLSQSTVARWEVGDLLPDRKHLPKIASFKNLSFQEFWEIVGEQYREETCTIAGFNDEEFIFCQRHSVVLNRGVKIWNRWRKNNNSTVPQLDGASPKEVFFDEIDLNHSLLRKIDFRAKSLRRANLQGADLSEANLSYANLSYADLTNANLKKANLKKANLTRANLWGADLSEALLNDAYLCGANFKEANLSHADLSHADLRSANLSHANLQYALLKCCSIYGISVWNVKLKGAVQEKLFVSPYNTDSTHVNFLYNAILKSWEIELDLDPDLVNQIRNLQNSFEKSRITK